MKNLILSTIFIVSLFSCAETGKEVVQYYGTGDVSRRYMEVDGQKQGVMTDYYKEGQISAERLFENDLQVGKTTFYYPSGKIKEVQYYDQGKMHGGDTAFYESGQPQFLRTYHHGMLEGYVRKWAEDGTLVYEARFEDDQVVEVKGDTLQRDTTLWRHAIDTVRRK